MAVNCKLWLLAAVLVAIVDLHHGPRGNGVLCGKSRRVRTEDDDGSSAAASDESSGDEESDDERSADGDRTYRDAERRQKSKSKSAVDSDEEAADDSDAESDEEGERAKSKSKRRVRSASNRKGKNRRDDDDDDSMDDEEDEDGAEPKSRKSKFNARTSDHKVDDDESDVDEDDDNGRRREKRNRKKGVGVSGEENLGDDDDRTKLESSTVIISGDVKEVLKYINGEMISFQPKPLDFTKKQNKKLKSAVEKVLIKKKSDKPEAKITVLIQNNFQKATSSKRVLKDAEEEKFFLDAMKKVMKLYYNQLKKRRVQLD